MTARVYVGTYAKYNNGSIKGAWLDLDDYIDSDHFYEACQELHSDEEDPELMFQDFEGFPQEWYGESSIDDKAFGYAAADSDDQAMVDAYLSAFGDDGSDFDELLSEVQDRYQGDFSDSWDPKLGFAEQLFDEIYAFEIPESVRGYIDYEAYARDIFIGDYVEVDGHIFSNY